MADRKTMNIITLRHESNIIFQGKDASRARTKDGLIVSKNKSDHDRSNSSGRLCLKMPGSGLVTAVERYFSIVTLQLCNGSITKRFESVLHRSLR